MAKRDTTTKPQEVVVSQPTSGGQVAVNPAMEAMEAFAGQGMERVTSKDVLIPRLGLVQALSDQVKRGHSSYIEDAQIGDIVDAGTNELMPRPLHVIPVVYDKVYLEWAPRASGKGLIAIHPDESIMSQTQPDSKGRPTLPNGNYVAETAQVYLLNLSAGRRPSFLPFTSTQLKKARRWMTLAQGERLTNSAGKEYIPPLFYRSYFLDSAMEKNNEGEWAGWTLSRGPAMPDIENWQNLMGDAVSFRDSIMKGLVKGDLSDVAPDANTIDTDGRPVEGRM